MPLAPAARARVFARLVQIVGTATILAVADAALVLAELSRRAST